MTLAQLWAEFAGQALAGNLSRNAATEVQVESAARAADQMLMVFNRRFKLENGVWVDRGCDD